MYYDAVKDEEKVIHLCVLLNVILHQSTISIHRHSYNMSKYTIDSRFPVNRRSAMRVRISDVLKVQSRRPAILVM
jgi:hypothetical protein